MSLKKTWIGWEKLTDDEQKRPEPDGYYRDYSPYRKVVFSPENPNIKKEFLENSEDYQPLWDSDTITEQAEIYCNYLDHISKDGLTEKEKQQRESVKDEIRKFAEVFNHD